jgi:2-iminobutanoate/2-iminopropanoate deaminase
MATIERIQPEGVAQPYAHYSTVSRVGSRIYVAGLVPIDDEGNLVAKGSPREQAAHVSRTLEAICAQFGADLGNVASCVLYITNREHYREVDAGFAHVFGEHRPSRATVIVGLTDPEFLVELVSIVEL